MLQDRVNPGRVTAVEHELRTCLDFIRSLPLPKDEDFRLGREQRRRHALRIEVLSRLLAEHEGRCES